MFLSVLFLHRSATDTQLPNFPLQSHILLVFAQYKLYDHGRHLASQFRLDPEKFEVVSPLIALPSHHLVVPAGCHIASHCPLLRCHLVVLLRQLVVALPLVILSLRCSLIIFVRKLVVTLNLAVLSLRHPLVVMSPQLVDASPLLVLSLHPAPLMANVAEWLDRRLK